MNKKLSLFIKTAVFLAILCVCFICMSLLVERKSSFNKNQEFFEEAKKDHIDAFFLGSSHVINGINPLQLFEDYGYTSYNLGGYGSVLLSSYWQMMLALDYCTPKLVVVDSYMLENNIRYIDDPEANVSSDELHLNIDRFPLSRTKYHAINDMFQDRDEKYPYLADFIVYHDRWKELEADDFKRFTKDADVNRMMGAVMEYGIHSQEYTYTDFQAGTLEQETVGTAYLRRIIEECQSRNIQVVVVTLPFLAMYDNQAAAHTATQIAAEYGVPSLNMLEIPGIIDVNTDMEDAGHLNVLGSRKVTSCLGDFIAQNCPLPDHREDSGYEKWNDYIGDYNAELASMCEGNDDLYTQLMMLQLNNSNKTFTISVRGDTAVYSDPSLVRQLHSLGATEMLDQAVSSNCSYMMISDHGVITEFVGDSENEFTVETSDGVFLYSPASAIYRILYVNGDTENNYLYSDDHAYADVQLLFFSGGVCTSHQYYTCDHFTYDYDQR
ncbi:hypothetical protein [Butyrivibrio sp. WCD2001]|uniref:hypothetical protein n=1 Tax=Butyrivibrio sp. WCD2001 TaxID=1280681 RepID=UPI0003FA7A10|nr:hypothetical protein [Butyrivibrio sp. WCD2001]